MTIEKERELFKQAYLNLRTADSIPFPDAVFDEYVRLRDSKGYKLVPVETLEESLSWASIAKWDSPSKERDLEIEKHEKIIEAMIGACDDH